VNAHVDQVHHTQGVAVGGILKRSINKREDETMMSEPGEEPVEAREQLYFGWKQKVRKDRKIASLNVT
jgi:hypothetical protein